MNVTETLNSRFTCRAFNSRPLEKDTILAIMEAANRTPSWANTQPWEIFVAGGEVLESLRQACLENFRQGVPGNSDLPRAQAWPPEITERMHSLMAARSQALGIDRADQTARKTLAEQNHRFFGAPVVAYLCMERSLTPWSIHDLGMMAQSIMLAAQERGVASAIAYNLVVYPDLIRKAINIPDDLAIIIGIALGYADTSNPQNVFRSPRRNIDEVVRFRGI
ncbi:MAG: nitroreductase [Thermoleophilia bacterium]|jgi:nitroreductase